MRLALALVVLAACGEPRRPPVHRHGAPIVVQPVQHEREVLRVPRAEDTVQPDEAASRAAGKLLAVIGRTRGAIRTTRYQARTQVRARDGHYAFDCSGMTTWLLRKAAPRALAAIASARPVARDYYRAIAKAPVGKARKGWQRVAHVKDARPGDLFAFLRSPLSTSKITGHVGVVVGEPVEVPGWPGAYAVRILDATRLPHQDDTRADDGVGGFGFGTMMFVTDEHGEVQAYGWFGTESAGLMPTHVVFGRVAG